MLRRLTAAALLTALPSFALAQTAEPAWDPKQVDLSALISCQGQPEQFLALAIAVQDPLKAVALGWRPLPQANMFMTEYALNVPVTVFGHSSQHIAFAGSSVMAILDLPDPRPLARQLDLEAAVDTPEKAMFGKEVLSEEARDQATGNVLIRSAVLNVSNVTSHPGKTLVGCSYSIDPAEETPETPAAELGAAATE
jgi:hypothetical protein